MSLSVHGAGTAAQAGLLEQMSSPAEKQDGGGAKTAAPYGSTPAAALSISAQAKAAAAKALAIKSGHDPDGIQDGK